MSNDPLFVSPTADGIRIVSEAILQGHLAIIPTDTVYGVAAKPTSECVAKLFTAKQRPPERPVPLLISDVGVLPRVVCEWPDTARQLSQKFWPGALTIVVPARHDVPPEITAGYSTVGIRMPDHAVAKAIIARAGGILAVTSANRSNEPPTTSARAAAKALAGSVRYVMDAGETASGLPSTVIALNGQTITLLREGAISLSRLHEALRCIAPQAKIVRA